MNAFERKEADMGKKVGGLQKKGAAFDERLLAREAGVRRRFVARWRYSLGAREEDWVVEGGRVALTEEGARKAMAALGVRVNWARAALTAAFEKKEGAVSVRVFKCPTNVKTALCMRLDRQELVVVRVRDNRTLRAGDEFDAAECAGGELELLGSWPAAGW
jgi:hypothetical protein